MRLSSTTVLSGWPVPSHCLETESGCDETHHGTIAWVVCGLDGFKLVKHLTNDDDTRPYGANAWGQNTKLLIGQSVRPRDQKHVVEQRDLRMIKQKRLQPPENLNETSARKPWNNASPLWETGRWCRWIPAWWCASPEATRWTPLVCESTPGTGGTTLWAGPPPDAIYSSDLKKEFRRRLQTSIILKSKTTDQS